MSFSKRPLAEDGIGWGAHEVWEDGAGQRDAGLLLLLLLTLILGVFLGALTLLLVLVLVAVLVPALAAVVLRLLRSSGSLPIALQLVLTAHKHLAQLGERHVLLVTVFVPGQMPPKARLSF